MSKEAGVLSQSLPVVAAIIGQKIDVPVAVHGDKAYTDGTRVVIPCFQPEEADMRDDAYAFIFHEASHIRWTDFSVPMNQDLAGRLTNIFEDARCECLVISHYAGAERLLGNLSRRVLTNPRPTKRAEEALLLLALSGARSNIPGQAFFGQLAEEALTHFAMLSSAARQVFDLIQQRVPLLSSTSDARALAEEVISLAKLNSPTNPKNDPGSDDHQGRPSEEAGPGDDDQGQLKEGTGSVGDNQAQAQQGEGAGPDNDIETDVGVAAAKRLHAAARAQPDEERPVALPSAVAPANNGNGQGRLRRVVPTARLMAAQFECLAQAEARVEIRHRSTGRTLDPRRLYRVALGDPNVFRDVRRAETISAAFHILVDKSQSMRCCISDALDAALAVSLAVQGRRGISLEASAFPGPSKTEVYTLGEGQVVPGALDGLRADGTTPMAEAMHYAASRLAMAPGLRKVMIVVADGGPDNFASATRIAQQIGKSGYLIIGIAIGEVAHAALSRFTHSCVKIENVNELAAALSGVVKHSVYGRR